MNSDFLKRALPIIALAIPLTGCLDDDNDNKDVVAALEEQNALLEKQLEQSQQQEQIAAEVKSVTLFTSVVDADLLTDVGPVTVQFREGPTWREDVQFDSGEIYVADVKPMSDFEMVISSPNDAFVRRVFFGQTQDSSAENTYQQLDAITVSAPIKKAVKIVNVDTGEAISGLELKAYSHIGEGGVAAETYAHTSTYDAESENYEITLPEGINLYVKGSLDPDNDGEANYDVEYGADGYSLQFYIYSDDIAEDTTIGFTELQGGTSNPYTEVEVRISVLDENGNSVDAAAVAISDELNGELAAVFDVNEEQYVLAAKLDGEIRIDVSAFANDDVFYGSSYLTLSLEEDDRYYIYTSNNRYERSYDSYATDGVLNLVIGPYVTETTSSLELTAKSEDVSGANYQASFYYSSPIAITESSSSLLQKNVWTITRGNDDDNDLVLPGTTVYSISDVEVPHVAELSLNDTRLTLHSELSLVAGFDYSYQVNEVEDVTAAITRDISDDYLEFSVPASMDFSIDQLILDNGNYWSDGAELMPLNTAGVAANTYERDATPSLYLPTSIASLKNLTLSKVLITDEGIVQSSFDTYDIVKDGEIYYSVNQIYAISAADNEELVFDGDSYGSTTLGTTLAEGHWYSRYISGYLGDDEELQENSITFEYAFETMDGVIETGTITLPVK